MRRKGVAWGLTDQHPTRTRLSRLAVLGVTGAALATTGMPAFAGGGTASTPLPDMYSVDQVVGAPTVWAQGGTGQGIGVALLDTGVTPVQGLNAPGKLAYGPDLSFDSQNPSLANLDGYGHGTALAGIIAGNDGTAGGYTGVAPGAHIVSVKVGSSTGAADVSQMIAGIDWIVQHANDPGMNIRVLNLSLGTDSAQSYQLDPLAHAAENAWHHGIVVVAAVGNDGTSNNNVADPASDPYLIDVGAEDPNGTIDPSDDVVASFSSRGTGQRHADIVAPGAYVEGLLSPNSTLANQNPGAIFDGRFLRGSGSSQAAAVTSGAVADLLSLRPGLDPDQVKALLTSTAVRISTHNPNFAGSGLISLPDAVAAVVPKKTQQSYRQSTGFGSLQAARGTGYVALNGVALTGEQDIFGKPWNASVIAPAEESGTAWNGGVFNGASWSGASWSGASWSGASWSGASWSGASWSGASWSGASWSGASWSGASWSGATWAGASWS